MIGYKATYNGYCLNQLYEVGQTYTLDGKMKMCVRGFHFCQDLFDVFKYYPYDKNIEVFEVESLGDVKNSEDKSVTNKIKILKEVDLKNMIVEKYDKKRYFNSKGNYIKYETAHGYYQKLEYDKNDNCIKYENSENYWEKREYDSNSNCIKEEFSNGSWYEYEYDENNNLIKTEYGKG